MYRIKNSSELASYIEYANLNNLATKEDMKEFLENAKKFDFYGITINPSFIKLAKEELKDTNLKISTVISFPLGFDLTKSKIEQAKIAVDEGADEIGTVINISQVKNSEYEALENEIRAIKEVIGEKVLKVIREAKALHDNEIVKVSQASERAGADYIETSTGFVSPNTIYEDVNVINLIQKYAPKTKIKLTGGVRLYKIANQLLTAGADLIGSNEGYQIVDDYRNLRENTKVTPKPIKFD